MSELDPLWCVKMAICSLSICIDFSVSPTLPNAGCSASSLILPLVRVVGSFSLLLREVIHWSIQNLIRSDLFHHCQAVNLQVSPTSWGSATTPHKGPGRSMSTAACYHPAGAGTEAGATDFRRPT
ncbi:unnamed protein product [Peronospora belbahrii]|uniref:Uncharacterized protein n=1 Tax=Peronospora belbahrii TaxID=622444 RepID=A0ABN8D6E9_9STRA|nr:unnamed protein product [Peronospora belbahrii]